MRMRLQFSSLLLVGALVGPNLAYAQAKPIPEFDKLRTPSSPAFVLLGISPTRIQRPNTPATIVPSLIEAFGQNRERVPSGYALEVAPYWLFPHPKLTLDDYAQDPASLIRTFTVSVGTSESTASETPGDGRTSFALGLRTMLVSSTDTAGTNNQCIRDAQAAAAKLAEAIGRIVTPWIVAHPTASAAEIEEQRELAYQAALDNAPPAIRKEIEETTEQCVDILSVNRGFTLDLSGGGAWSFRDGIWETGKAATAGIWLTPSWKAGENGNVVGIGSVIWQGLDDVETRMVLDGGVRGIYAWKTFAISAETIYRRISSDALDDDQFRVDLGFDIQLRDGIWLTSTFGKDFSAANARSFLAIANLQWNIGDRSIKPRTPIS